MTDAEKADLTQLMDLPAFRRFMFRAIQNAGIWSATANGADGRNLYLEGRRSLGLDILREVETAMPIQHPSGIPMLTLHRILTEEIQTPAPEKPNGRRTRDQYRDISPDDGNADE